MKWLDNRGAKHNNSERQGNFDKSLLKSILLFIGLITCFVGTGAFFYADAFKLKAVFNSDASSKQSLDINKIAENVSIKVLDTEFLGSGFIVKRENDKYVVITNQHVLRAGEAPYKIKTPDGTIHQAKVVPSSVKSKYEYDLAVLEFSSRQIYPTAQIGSSLYLKVGEPVYAAGFPYTNIAIETSKVSSEKDSQINPVTGLTLKTGRIAIILNKALEEGYQIGYTNDVQKGMSGGALFNARGEVVGVNGKHAYPLWESPELYQDGSQPCPKLEKLITQSSLAIPIEKTIQLNPQLQAIQPESNLEATLRSDLVEEDPVVIELQKQAEETARSCDNYGTSEIE